MNDLPFDASFNNIEDKTEATIVPIDANKPKDIVISTPLFDVTLKNTMSKSHVVRPGQFLNIMMLNAIANKLVIQIADLVVKIQIAVIGEEATVGDNPTPIYHMFDSNGNLKPEYSSRTTNTIRAEALFAEADAHVESAYALDDEKNKYFPTAKDGLQYAYIFELGKGRAITDLKEAIAYQRPRSSAYTNLQAKMYKRAQTPVIAAPTETLSHAAMLGF